MGSRWRDAFLFLLFAGGVVYFVRTRPLKAPEPVVTNPGPPPPPTASVPAAPVPVSVPIAAAPQAVVQAPAKPKKLWPAKSSRGPWTMRVLVIAYYPLLPDGETLDLGVTSNVGGSLLELRDKVAGMNTEVMASLSDGSRYHGYRQQGTTPSIRFKVVAEQEVLEAMPHDPRKSGFPDYRRILERAGVQRYVEELGVDEVWIWGYHSPQLAPWESNMASRYGDISNSDRDPADLPIFDRTYVVYHYNYQRQTSEAVHNHIHQIEAVMRRYGGELWKTFEGEPGNWRAGNCHFPPNGRSDYDWSNQAMVWSDIEDWRPEGKGRMQEINCETWGCSGLPWFVYWMQNIPGLGNDLTYNGRPLTNWWRLIADPDSAQRSGLVSRR